MPTAPQPRRQDKPNFGWIIAAILVIAFFIWIGSQGSSVSGPSNNASASLASSTALQPQAPAGPAQPLPLNPAAARHGIAQFMMVAAQHVPGSSEIFVRNCYEALGNPFNWHQLDRCGGYDALASRWTEVNESNAGQDDLTYFQSEAAATRYTKAAIAGGLQADAADRRWAAIHALAAKSRLAGPKPAEAAPEPAAPTDQTALGNLSQNDAGTEQ